MGPQKFEGVCEQTVALFFQLTSDVLNERKKETTLEILLFIVNLENLVQSKNHALQKQKKTLVKIWYVQTYIWVIPLCLVVIVVIFGFYWLAVKLFCMFSKKICRISDERCYNSKY